MTLRSNKSLRVVAVCAAVVLLGTACTDDAGNSEDSDTSEADGSGGGEKAVGAQHVGAPEVPGSCEDASGAKSPDDKSEDGASDGVDPQVAAAIEKRGEPDPATVVGEVKGATGPVDLVEGTGEAVTPGGGATIHYSLINPADNTVLESSWTRGEPLPTAVTDVFPGFAELMKGMKVGGRRAFVVPAVDLVGDPPPPQTGLTAEDNVLFVVDLFSVSEKAPEQPGAVETDEDALKAAEDRGAPEVEVPEGTAETTELIWIDDVVGEGDVVCPGDTVLAHYTGIQASDGEQFDSSWERGEPIEFPLDGVIEGWTKGLVGMKVGGRRTLVIPADQAYGEEGSGGSPSGVLVFTIDLIGVS